MIQVGYHGFRKTKQSESFHWDIWLVLALENWIFDFGRPIAAVRSYVNLYQTKFENKFNQMKARWEKKEKKEKNSI